MLERIPEFINQLTEQAKEIGFLSPYGDMWPSFFFSWTDVALFLVLVGFIGIGRFLVLCLDIGFVIKKKFVL